MTMFSSRPPFNDDLLPYVWPGPSPISGGETRSMFSHGDGIALRYDPRPEFDRPQHNPTNPILTAVRSGDVTAREVLDAFAPGFDQFAYSYSVSMIDHARRVLTRLANLTKEN